MKLEHPVMNASGVLGARVADALELVEAGVSALVTKSFTRERREGNPTPIIVPVEAGYVNSVGLANPGVGGLRELLVNLRSRGVSKPVIVSIAAATPREAEELVEVAVDSGAAGIEVNLSCPHAKGRGLEIGYDRRASREVVEAAVSAARGRPVWVKLGLVDHLPERAAELIEAGARAVTLINTLRAMVIDIYARKPVLGGVVGGLSGKAIHPVAVRAVYDTYCEYGLDVIGVGGVYEWRDAVELMVAGARAVQVGTAIFDRGLSVIREIIRGLRGYLDMVGASSVVEIIGSACRR